MRHLFAFVLILSGFICHSQIIPKGSWEGSIKIGKDNALPLVFNFSDSAGRLLASMDSPEQGAFNIRSDSTMLEGDSLKIYIRANKIQYTGRILSDTLIQGVFKQGMKFPLTLRPGTVKKRNTRPQTPQPPFGYEILDTVYHNADNSITFGATLTFPRCADCNKPGYTGSKFPAVLLVSGSGQQNRDEELLGHKPFWVLADHLTKNGYAVMRVDDRGVGQTTGKASRATSLDFADDAEASLNFLKTLPFIDPKKIGMAGHSEGGLIASVLASRRNDLAFIVLLASPGLPGTELMAAQNAAILRVNNLSEKSISAYDKLYVKMTDSLLKASDSLTAVRGIRNSIAAWASVTDTSILNELGFADAGKQNVLARAFIKQAYNPWFLTFLKTDPADYLKQTNVKVLAINGDKDVQVVSGANLEGIRKALKKRKSKAVVTIKEMSGLNHLFQTCEKCTPNEYGKLEETFSPEALNLISQWLKENISGTAE